MKILVGLVCVLSCAAAANSFLGGTTVTDARGRVTAVNLRSSWIEDSDLLEVARLSTVTDLDLSETRITDIGFQALKTLPNVSRMNLYYAEQIGDGALAAMKGWKQLRSLNLRGTKVTDAGLVHLAGLPIETLDVGYSFFTDNGFDALVNLPKLKHLAVGGNKITDTGLNAVRLLTTLTELDLSGAQRTDSGIWAATITDRSIETVDSLQSIQLLNLKGAKFTDTGFAKLTRLKQLKRIDLGETNLSAIGLASLNNSPLLEQVNLYNAKRVGDEVVPILAGLSNLRWVDLTGTAVTAKGIQTLKAANSRCTVIWENPAN
jgi:internalin A